MLSNRDGPGMRSARKYAVHGSSPLARDSTNNVTPLRNRRKDSFNASNHIHGLGGEAKEAMLRSGLRVKRTNSLRVVATKGNATLTAAFHHNFPVPDLDIYRKNYSKKEYEFAESIPSAMCPFQFVTNENQEMVALWQHTKDAENLQQQFVPVDEPDESKMSDWLKDMRLKVHVRLAQKQQFVDTANPVIETQPLQVTEQQEGTKREREKEKGPTSPKTPTKKPEKPCNGMELSLDAIVPSSSPRSQSARTFSKPRLSPKSSNRVAPSPFPSTPSSPSSSPSTSPTSSPNKKAKKDKRLPPLQPRSNTTSHSSHDKSRLPKISSHDSTTSMLSVGPLFHPRNDPILARRTYSEQDVRRVRAKARNSVGLEAIS